MSLVSKIKAFFRDPQEQIYEMDYQRTAAQLLRGQVDDLGEGYDLTGVTKGGMDAMTDFRDIANHFINIGREKERKLIGLEVKNNRAKPANMQG